MDLLEAVAQKVGMNYMWRTGAHRGGTKTMVSPPPVDNPDRGCDIAKDGLPPPPLGGLLKVVATYPPPDTG